MVFCHGDELLAITTESEGRVGLRKGLDEVGHVIQFGDEEFDEIKREGFCTISNPRKTFMNSAYLDE